MSARVEQFGTTHSGTLLQAPDVKRTRDGRWFLAERFSVHVRPQSAWVWVEGRAIRTDGSIGRAHRGDGYNLRGRSNDPHAPSWLTDALTAAGVTW